MHSSKEDGRNLPKYVPRVVWFEVEEEGSGINRGEESRQLLLEKVESLEHELSWLRMRMKMLEGEDEEDKDGDPRHLVFELGSVPRCSTLMAHYKNPGIYTIHGICALSSETSAYIQCERWNLDIIILGGASAL